MSALDLLFGGTGGAIRTNKQVANVLGNNQLKGFNYGRTALNQGADQEIGTLQDYSQQAQNSIYGGTGQQVGAYQAGMAPWQTIFAQSGEFLPTYSGALGLGSEEDVADARDKFQASPGYDYTLGQGIEAAARTGQSTGQLGAANMDAMKFAHNLSDQDYQQWIDNLFRGVGVNEDAAKGIQFGQGQIGDAYGGQGSKIAELLAKTGGSIADVQGGLGKDLASLGETYYGNKGQIQANRLNANKTARATADQNSLNALFGIANLGVNAFTGGLGSGFGSLFGGGGAAGAGGDPMSDYNQFSYTNGIPTYENY